MDFSGSFVGALTQSISFSASTAPTLSAFFKGTATCAAGDWLMAHASDPLQGMGNAGYAPGSTTISGALKLKLLYIVNTDTTNTITIARGTLAGLPIFDAADDSITLAAGDSFLFYKKAGTATLTTTSNDKLTISVGGGSPTADVLAIYGA